MHLDNSTSGAGMAYAIRYRTSAKREFEQCCQDYPSLGEQLRRWIRELAAEADPRSGKKSIDLFDVLDSLLADDLKDRWRHVRDKWKAAGTLEMTKAFLATEDRRGN